jgi:hypothetical protein
MRKLLIPMVAVVMALAVQADSRAQTHTSLHISNGSGSAVTAWLNLNSGLAGRILDVRLVDVSTNQPVSVTPLSGNDLLGSFRLNAGQTVSWDSFSGQRSGGSVTFRSFPQSCPTEGGPCGVTKGEFAINTGNESADVSSVDGINAIVEMDLTDGGGTAWPTNPASGRAVTRNSGTLTGDKPLWGVFPYRCAHCAFIGSDSPPWQCNPLGEPNQDWCKSGTETDPSPVKCQADRVGAGGTVKFTFIEARDPR